MPQRCINIMYKQFNQSSKEHAGAMATTTNKIKRIGNGHFLPLSAATMDALQLRAGQQVTLSTDDGTLIVRTVNDDYTKTREAAAKVTQRYRRTLVKLGREGDVA